MTDVSTLLTDAISWAREAGAVQLSHFRSGNLHISAKFNQADVVTVADKAAEKSIITNIRRSYPSHAVLTEESGAIAGDGGWRWVIDPLDGTTNFSNGLPLFSVSIAVEHNDVPVIGVVFAPYLNELFHAIKGEGAFLNGKKICPSTKEDLSHAVVATGFPVDKDRTNDNNIDNVVRVLPRVRGLRRLGSAAIDLCYVAAGFLDGYWELNLHEWDVAAGSLIVKEAGGEIAHFRRDRNISILASNKNLHTLLLALLSDTPPVIREQY